MTISVKHLGARLALLGVLSTCFASAQAVDPRDLLSPAQAFSLSTSVASGESNQLDMKFEIAPGYYLYRDRIGAVDATTGKALPVDTSAGEKKNDPNFGDVEIYHDAASAHVDFGSAEKVRVTWQGCAEAGVCFAPQTREIDVHPAAVDASVSHADLMPATQPEGAGSQSIGAVLTQSLSASDMSISTTLLGVTPPVAMAVFFLLGIVLAFTPCMLPMLPIVSSIVVGAGATRKRGFGLSLTFVIAMSIVYAAMGVAAAAAGSNFQILLQKWWITAVFGGVLIVLAMAMFGVFTLQLPAFLTQRLSSSASGVSSGTVFGAALSGAFAALLVGPCMTAPLAGTLMYIARTGDLVWGGTLLLTLGFGIGAPFLLVGILGPQILPKPGAWMRSVNAFVGFSLLATAILMIERITPESAGLAMWGAWMIAIAATLLVGIRRSTTQSGTRASLSVLAYGGAFALGLWGSAMWIGALGGSSDVLRPLAVYAGGARAASIVQADAAPATTVRTLDALRRELDAAKNAHIPVLVDFTADWCTSCRTLDRTVFADARVQKALSGYRIIHADVTNTDSESQALMNTYGVIGPPTVMLFDTQGREQRDARLVGEFEPKDLLSRLSTSPAA